MNSSVPNSKEKWICCQIGAREHYAIARSLAAAESLELLITDYWSKESNATNIPIIKNLHGRKHPDLPDEKVVAFNLSSLCFEVLQKIIRSQGWDGVMNRNQWFQKKVVSCLSSMKNEPTHIFSYSYAAQDIFKYAKSKGWVTILGQIDPGPLEEDIVLNELRRYPEYHSEWLPAPQAYWDNWYRECELADKIIVNSEWSYKALLKKGIDSGKMRIIPLSYSPPKSATSFNREYPSIFNKERPLRILFLGQVILRKGIARVIEAARLMYDEPVEFIVAGPIGIKPLPQLSNLKWIGRIPRLEVDKYFKSADIFLFPTLSDGFGLTQLEARAWKLPVITSPHCGNVIKNGISGFVINDLKGETIASLLNQILMNPKILPGLASDDSYNEQFDILRIQ